MGLKFRRLQRESVDREREALISAHSSVNCLNCGAPLAATYAIASLVAFAVMIYWVSMAA